jgi:hypothetical protein
MKSSLYCRKVLGIERLEDRHLLSAASPGDLLLAIHNPTPNAGDQFGAAIASVGDNILVGAPLDDTSARDAGIAYLFDGTTGELLRTFPDPANGTHPPLAVSDTFGASVAAIGQNVLIGAPLADFGALNAGAAYLFDGTTGDLLRTFYNPEPGLGDQFGSVVLALGDDILIGAPFDSQYAASAGSVYLFDGETGELLQEFPDPANLTHPAPIAYGEFGGEIAVLDADHILIGSAPRDTVFLFQRTDGGAWDLERTIANPDLHQGALFGESIAAAGDQVLVGAVFDETYGGRAGIAYQFDASTEAWTWHRVPDSENPTDLELTRGDQFGISAAAVGRNFLVGSDQPYTGAGVAYLLDGAGGDVLLAIANPEPAAGDRFGNQVAAWGNDLIVAAPFDDDGAADAGSVYVFKGAESAGDTPPTVSDIADQTVNEDTSTGPLSFTVGDAESGPDSLVVTAESSDPARIPDANLILGGSGADRTIEVVPAPDQNGGPVTITIAVSDGTSTTNETFEVYVTAVNDAPSFTIGADQSVPEDAGPQSVPGFAAEISAGPADESGQRLTFLVESGNPGLFAVQPAIDAATGQLTYTPAPDANGVAEVMVRLMDDGGTANGGVDTSPVLSFAIEVLSEQQQIENLLNQIGDLGSSGVLNGGQVKSLSGTLENVQSKLDRGQLTAAVNQLGAFGNHVKSLVDEGVLSPEDGQALIDAAEDVSQSILTGPRVETIAAAEVDAAFAQIGREYHPAAHGSAHPGSGR